MEIHARYVWVGLITFALILLTIWYVLWISIQKDSASNVLYDIYFSQNVAGLQIGSGVFLRGVQVGRVSEIQFAPEYSGTVRVRITVSDAAPIRQDSVATVEPQGITGLANIQITGGSPNSPYLRPLNDESIPIITAGISKFDEILSAVPHILVTTKTILNKINDTLDTQTLAQFKQIIADTSITMKNLAEQKQNINRFITDITKAFITFDQTNVALQKYITTQISPLTQRLASIIDDVPGIISSLNTKLEDVTLITTDTQKAITQAKLLFMNLNKITHAFQENPKQFFFGRSLPDFKN